MDIKLPNMDINIIRKNISLVVSLDHIVAVKNDKVFNRFIGETP